MNPITVTVTVQTEEQADTIRAVAANYRGEPVECNSFGTWENYNRSVIDFNYRPVPRPPWRLPDPTPGREGGPAMSDHPRTDKIRECEGLDLAGALSHAEDLERELADQTWLTKQAAESLLAVNAERERERKDIENVFHECGIDLPDEGLPLLRLVGILIEKSHSADAEELAVVRADLDRLQKTVLRLMDEKLALTAERDALKAALHQAEYGKYGTVALTDERDAALAKLTTAREALRVLVKDEHGGCNHYPQGWEMARAALAETKP